jgi:hypothetical protein
MEPDPVDPALCRDPTHPPGYHELSDAGDGFLRHEVLLSSGAVLLVEFRDVSVERVDPASPPAAT